MVFADGLTSAWLLSYMLAYIHGLLSPTAVYAFKRIDELIAASAKIGPKCQEQEFRHFLLLAVLFVSK